MSEARRSELAGAASVGERRAVIQGSERDQTSGPHDGFAYVAALAQPDDLVDRVEVGAGRRLDDVGGQAPAGHRVPVDLEAQGHVRQGVDPAGDRGDRVVGEAALGAGFLLGRPALDGGAE